MGINILVAMTSNEGVHIAMKLEELCQNKFVKLLFYEVPGTSPPIEHPAFRLVEHIETYKKGRSKKMKREIYEVHMAYVNKDGYHASDPTGYPKIVDSSTAEYGNDTEKALKKAYGYLGAAESTLSTQDHQVGYCYLIRCSDGKQIECRKFGRIADLPDPEPEPEPETEEEEQNG